MKNIFTNRYLLLGLRLFLGAYFIYAAMAKVMLPAEFAAAIRDYDLIPVLLSPIPAVFLPWLEFFAGLFLLAGLFGASASVLLAGLTTVFTAAIISALARGLEINCGCGVSLAGVEEVSIVKVIENAAIIAALVWLSLHPSRLAALDVLRK